MLEQELHNQELNNFNNQETPVQPLAPEPDLFRNYEIKNFELSPRLYKIFAASAIFNVMALLIFAQGNLLTRKGCDSPMVSKVCQVLDTVTSAHSARQRQRGCQRITKKPNSKTPKLHILMSAVKLRRLITRKVISRLPTPKNTRCVNSKCKWAAAI